MRHEDHAGGRVAVRSAPPVSRARRHPAPVPRVPTRHSQATLRFVAGGALILALVSAAFGTRGFLEASSARSEVRAMRGSLSGLQHRVGMDEARAAGDRKRVRAVAAQIASARRQSARVASQLADVPNMMQGIRDRLAAFASCVPELQREISGIVVSWHMGPFKASPDYVTLADKAHLSKACAVGAG
jgi:hypothetical protein